MGLLALIFFVAAASPDIVISYDPTNPIDMKALAPFFTFFAIFMLACMVILICCAVIYLKNASKSYQELHKSSKGIITAIVLSFLFGGFLTGIFGLLGYITNPIQTTQEPANSQSTSKDINSRLEQLKEMKDGGIISDEEYENKKKEILNDF